MHMHEVIQLYTYVHTYVHTYMYILLFIYISPKLNIMVSLLLETRVTLAIFLFLSL